MKYPFDFLVLPEAVWLDERISYGAKHLLAILLRYSNNGFYKEVSQRWLSEKMKVQAEEIRRRTRELESVKYIETIERRGRVNGFKINISFFLSTTPHQMDTPLQQGGDTPLQPRGVYTREDIQERNTEEVADATPSEDSQEIGVDDDGVPTSSREQSRNKKVPQNLYRSFTKFKAFFSLRCEKIKGFKPVLTQGDIWKYAAVRGKILSDTELGKLVDFFLSHEKSDKATTIAACLSNHTINLWKQEYQIRSIS